MASASAGRLSSRIWRSRREAHPIGERLEEGDLYGHALVGTFAPEQRRQDIGIGVHPGREVGDCDAGLGGCLRGPRDGDETGLALYKQVVGLFVPVRAEVP